MLKSINLSLSSICGANCIYCPSNRGKNIKQKIMPFNYVKMMIDEISSDYFKKYHKIKRIEIGENGDAFLNKELIKSLRYIKKNLPEIKVEIYSNFQNFTTKMVKIILKDNLIDFFYVNIDGSTPKNYLYVKGIILENTMQNIYYFLKLRKELNVQVTLNVRILSLFDYVHTIYNNFGFYPEKIKNYSLIEIPDDSLIIKDQIEKFLDKAKDTILISPIIGWAERGRFQEKKINYKRFSCPKLRRIQREAFIAPDGSWYACCLDSNNKLILGNINDQSLNDIYHSQKRKNILHLLKKKNFEFIGEPCNTVNCCQILSQ